MTGYPKAPDLQALVARFGKYDRITPEAWADHAIAMQQWHIDRRIYTCGRVIGPEESKQIQEKKC